MSFKTVERFIQYLSILLVLRYYFIDQAELNAQIYHNQTSFPHALSLKRSR